ncbi:MAG TPA: NADH-quinone oxidoreductase subunit A [Gemmataceae bacterium]|nr:NADH-quinone oxidoreductase subunit A [Gemmataceae bacterium]
MTELVGYLVLFLVVAIGFLLVHLLIGKLVRPAKMDAEKATIYECGEPTIGSAWVQFDLRFYVVALLFVIFDVEVAFFFPWAVVFGHANTIAQAQPGVSTTNTVALDLAKRELLGSKNAAITPETAQAAKQFGLLAFVDIIVFFGVLLVGFAYLWRRGDLTWVRSTAAERAAEAEEEEAVMEAQPRTLVGARS